MAQTNDDIWDRLLKPWWAKAALGLVLMGLAVAAFSRHERIEAGGERPTIVSKGDRVLYDLGGKWLVAGLPGVIGLGMLGWGVWQLTRQAGVADAGPSATPLPQRVGESEEGAEPLSALRMVQFVYVEFWRVVFGVIAVAFMALAVGLVKLIWCDPAQYVYLVAILLAVPVGYLATEGVGRWIGADEGPIVDWRSSTTWLVVVGYGGCLALAGFLAANETGDREAAERNAEVARREQEQRNAILNSPKVRAANEFIRLRQEQEAKRAASAPAAE